MLGKQSNLTYKDIRDFYEHFRAYCPKITKGHSGCVKLQHNSQERVKPKVIIYFVPFNKKSILQKFTKM